MVQIWCLSTSVVRDVLDSLGLDRNMNEVTQTSFILCVHEVSSQ